MALKTYNGTDVDSHLGSATITATGVTMTLAGITSTGVTAPNTTNKVTGCWICVASAPSNGGNITVEVMESGVAKALATINSADIQLGMNYVRYATPYQFTTTGGSAYTCRVKNTVGSSGQLRSAASGLWFQFTYDSTGAIGSTDDMWVGGFNDAGLTTKTLTLSGTSNAWGSKATTGIGSTSQTMGAALTIGSGGTVVYDQSASTSLTLKGSLWVTANGLFDMRPPSTKSIISTLIIDSTATGDQGIFTATSTFGGQILTTGATYDVYTTYSSGLGTAASPMIVGTAWDADVGDEIIIGGGTDYTKNELRYIKTRNSSTSFVLCTTPGGAEVALANTHTAGTYMANMTRNSIIKPLSTSLGWYGNNAASNANSSFNYTRCEYIENASGKAFTPSLNNGSTFDGMVAYQSPTVGGRSAILMANSGTESSQARTHTGIILYNVAGTNYSGQSGIGFSGTSNKTLNYCFQFNAPSSVGTCGFISLNVSSTANTFNNCHSYGGNSNNSSAGYVFGIYSSSANTFNNCTVNGCRQNAVYFSTASGTTFNNCSFGAVATNTIDIFTISTSLNQALFNACTFGSATLISNYLNQLDTSLIAFQDMDGNTSKHRWYTNYGSWWSAGAGLTDTTVRTVGSLSLVSKPENNTTGSSWIFKIPANPTSSVNIFGYVYRNATFSSGTLKAELFLPGTSITGTPDATYTFPTTTGAWLPFNLSAYNSGAVSRYAIVKITGITATGGAYFFVDDLYDAGTANKVAGLDLWDEGQPSPIMIQSDFSVVPAAVWADSASYTPGTKGANLGDALSNTDATQAKVDLL